LNEVPQLSADAVVAALRAVSPAPDSKRVADLQRFFKTEPGGYGEGDRFLGPTVPQTRDIAKKFRDLPLDQLDLLLDSQWHEVRLTALHIIVGQFQRAKTKALREELFNFYLDAVNRGAVNNWDLVDTSAPTFGKWLVEQPNDDLLATLAGSKELWERRLAIMLTFAHIRGKQFNVSLRIAKLLISDEHDLIHKAVGWMLREAGNREISVLRTFLAENHKHMPRTMLRYAIEKLDPAERAKWMAK
jgi:3-methyladenine DNA glycosylase AlkD